MKTQRSSIALLSVVCLTLVTLFTGISTAQELRGRVQGIITDPSEAVVVGAKITLRNVNTGVETTKETNQAGQYLFDFVSPGTYSLSVEMEGFGRFVQENILVETRGDVTVNVSLKVGTVAETVRVVEAPVSVQFNNSTMQLTIDTKMANDLPIITRNPFLLASLDPAVVVRSDTEQAAYHLWAPSQLDVGGNTSTKNDLLVDGVPNLVANKSSYVPPMDAVSELNVQQNSVDAEFGHSAGGIISLQMKSGTNEIHGTAYYLGRNPSLNAVSNSIDHTPNLVRNHIVGATVGGPIKKNRIFNFTAYERWNNKEPNTDTYTLPTDLERQGDFSKSLNIDGGMRQIFDPWSTKFDPSTNTATRTPFPNNQIPQSRLDPTAVRFTQDIWKSNNPGDDITGVNNYRYTQPLVITFWNVTSRTDVNISDKWKAFFRYSQFRTNLQQNNVTHSPAQPLNGFVSHSFHLSGDAVWTINPRTVFNIRGAYVSIHDSFDSPLKLKDSDLAQFWPNNPWYTSYLKELPAIYYPALGENGAGGTSQFGICCFWFQEPKTWNVESKVSQQLGRHYLKVGGEYRDQHILAERPRPMSFSFSPALTADTFINPDTKLSGDGWATFLLGAIDNNSYIKTIALQKPRVEIFGAYVQDDFKVSPRLTLNLGLRYEFETPMRDPQNRLSRFLDLTNPIPEFQNNPPQLPSEVTAIRKTAPAWNGAWIFTDSSHRGSWNPQKATFLPRVGLAYRLDNRTSLRAGWARFIVPPIMADGFGILGSTPYPGFSASSTVLPLLEGIPQSVLSDPFPADKNPLIPPVGKSLGRYTNLGGDAVWFHQNLRMGVNDRINISLQRQLPARVVLDVTYFLNLGHNHNYESMYNGGGDWKDWNQLDPQYIYTYKSQLDVSVPNPFHNFLTPEQFPGQLRNQTDLSVADLLKPYPQYGALQEILVPGVHTRYQALQLKAQRAFANGFNLVLGYNFNRERNEEFFNADDRFANKFTWQDSFNPHHRLTLAGIWQFPIGRDRRFMSKAPGVLDAIVGGWSVSGIFTYNSADFLRFGPAIVSGSPKIDNKTRDQMFDTSKFTRQPAFTPRSNPLQYPGVTGSPFHNIDLTLAKTHPITEKFKLEIRMEAYNFTNSFMGADPVTDVDSSLFGRVVEQKYGYYGRQFQYSARLIW